MSNGVDRMRFLVTEECGRLARWLRLCGYDTALMPAQPLSALYRRAYNESRLIVTRNHRVRPGQWFRVIRVRSHPLAEQLRQLMREAGLAVGDERRLSRCDRCNTPVEPIERPRVKDRVPPYVFRTQESFVACPSCRRIYWSATHAQRIRAMLDSTIA